MKSTFTGRFQDWLNDWSDAKTRQILTVVLAVMLGLLAGLLVYTIVKGAIYDLFPRPPAIDFNHSAESDSLLNAYPFEAYWAIVTSWIVGTLAGAYCAVRVAKLGEFPAWITGIALAAFYLLDLLFQPHTPVIIVLCPALAALCAWGGGWIGMFVTLRKGRQSRSNPAVPG